MELQARRRQLFAGNCFVEVQEDAGDEEISVVRILGHEFEEAVALDG